jgi:hypothetical protein
MCNRRTIRKRLKRQKKKGGKLPVNLVKLAKIAISPERGSAYWLLGLSIESDLQIMNGVRRRKKPWHRVSMMLHG